MSSSIPPADYAGPPMRKLPTPRVLAVHARDHQPFLKTSVPHIMLLAALGVQSEAHCGVTVRTGRETQAALWPA